MDDIRDTHMKPMKLKQNAQERPTGRALLWRQLILRISLILFSAFCLLKYFAWAWVFSGVYGLPSQASTVQLARHWSLAYLWAGLLAEVALMVHLAVYLKLEIMELSGLPKALGRSIVAIAIAVFGTLGAALLLDWLAKLIRHG
jgi:hypothetical protein